MTPFVKYSHPPNPQYHRERKQATRKKPNNPHDSESLCDQHKAGLRMLHGWNRAEPRAQAACIAVGESALLVLWAAEERKGWKTSRPHPNLPVPVQEGFGGAGFISVRGYALCCPLVALHSIVNVGVLLGVDPTFMPRRGTAALKCLWFVCLLCLGQAPPCSHGCPGSCCEDQAGLIVRSSPA